MKLLDIAIEGFMGFTGAVKLALDSLGLVHIAGANEDDPANDSNGSGKTTILEALTWCLFGEGLPRPSGNSEQGVRADEVLNDRRKKQCYVRVNLEDEDGTAYGVARWRKYKGEGDSRQSSGVMLVVGGEPIQSLDEKETNRLICLKLGLDRDIWCRGVVFGQEASFNFCEATAKDRTAILTTVMGLETIDTWLERCRDEKRALTTKMAESGGKLEIARQGLQRAEQESPEAQQQQWEVDRAATLQAIESDLTAIANEGTSLVATLTELETAGRPAVAAFPDPPSDEAVRAAERAMQEASVKTGVLRTEHDVLKRRVAQLESMQIGECPTCLQPITAEHRDPCLGAARESVASLINGQMWIEAWGAFEQAQKAYAAAQDAYKAGHAETRRLSEEAQRTQQQALQWDNSVQALKNQIEHGRKRWTAEAARKRQVQQQSNPFGELVAKHQEQLEQLRWELVALEDEQKGIGEALDICLWWEKELPRFRTWLFDAVVDTLAAEANRWLRIMSGGVIWVQISTTKQVGKRLRDELDVQVYRWQPDGSVTTRSYRTWSGGEKRRVALAVDLGLSRLLADRASKAYRFLALDEIDRHLDSQGREGLRQVLDELRREKETLLVITHDPEFRASFDTEVLVTKRAGVSDLEVRGAQAESSGAA